MENNSRIQRYKIYMVYNQCKRKKHIMAKNMGTSMYSITIGDNIINRYRLQWRGYNGKKYYVKHTRILHSISLQDVKAKVLLLFGSPPDNIVRV